MSCNVNNSSSNVAAAAALADRWDDGSSHRCEVRVADDSTTGHRHVSVVVAVVVEAVDDVVRRLCAAVAIAVHVAGHAVR